MSVRLGRCASHAASYDHAIPRAGRAIYKTKRWQVLRKHKLYLDPICEDCGQQVATQVHHRVDIADGGATWAMGNLQALCHSCHSTVGRQRQLAQALTNNDQEETPCTTETR